MIKELLILYLLAVTTHGTSSLQVNLTVVIDGYTVNSTLTSSATLPLGRTALLVCRVSGIPHGQQTSYQWTCPNQPCVQTGYAGRKISNNIIAINTTSTSDGGTYTCTVTAGGMKGRQDFGINVNGGAVAHSYGRLLENEAVITNKRQLQPPNADTGDGRIECTISGGMSRFSFSPYRVDSGNTQKATAVIPSKAFGRFNNIDGSCGNTFLYLYLNKTDGFPQVRSLTPSTDSRQSTITANMEFTYDMSNGIGRVITGYHRLDLGHEMVGQFHNNGMKKKLMFSALVPGARYRITAWGLGGGPNKKRGSAPAVLEVTTQPSDPSPPRALTITTVLEDGIELNWLPPRKSNGDIQHYIIRYTLQNGTGQRITTTDNINYYNLTGLEGGQTYYNFTVEAANLAHTSAQSNTIESYTHSPDSSNTLTTKSGTSTATIPTTTSITEPQGSSILYIGSGAGSLLLVLVAVLAVIICCVVAVHRRGKRSRSTDHTPTLHYYSTPGHEQEEEPQVQIGADNYDTVGENASFTPGTLYDEVEVKIVKPKPVAVPSEYQLPLVEADKEDDKEAHDTVTIPESFYAQPDTTAKSNKKGEKGTTADVEDPDVLYAEVDKPKKPKKKKKGKEKKEEHPQGDLYAVVDKTSKQKGKEKKIKEKEQQGDGDLYAEVDKTQKKGKNDMEEKASFVREQSDSPPPVPQYRMAYEPSADSCLFLNNNNNSNNSNSNNSNNNNNNNGRAVTLGHTIMMARSTQKISTKH
uniref:Insulin-like protein receptor n=1 Tax=Halisarca dujardinii TaxID=2583056 RepID=A0AA96MNW2_HALDU|nr:insulin-like protein receptor [Halisarca dujardinii]